MKNQIFSTSSESLKPPVDGSLESLLYAKAPTDALKPSTVASCHSCRWNCKDKISKVDQNQLQMYYNSLPDYKAKGTFLSKLVQRYKRQKQLIFRYSLPIENTVTRVCVKFFSGTFGVNSHIVNVLLGNNMNKSKRKDSGKNEAPTTKKSLESLLLLKAPEETLESLVRSKVSMAMAPQQGDTESRSTHIKKGRRNRARDPSKWKQNLRKVKRNYGEEYMTRSGKLRLPRPVTACENCRWNCKDKISPHEQNKLRMYYNYLQDYKAKKVFITNLVKKFEKKTKYYFKYFLPIGNTTVKVCRTFFCGTFGVHSHFVQYVFQSNVDKSTRKSIGRKTGYKKGNEVIKIKPPTAKKSLESLLFVKADKTALESLVHSKVSKNSSKSTTSDVNIMNENSDHNNISNEKCIINNKSPNKSLNLNVIKDGENFISFPNLNLNLFKMEDTTTPIHDSAPIKKSQYKSEPSFLPTDTIDSTLGSLRGLSLKPITIPSTSENVLSTTFPSRLDVHGDNLGNVNGKNDHIEALNQNVYTEIFNEEIDIEILEQKKCHKDLNEENNPQTENTECLFVDVGNVNEENDHMETLNENVHTEIVNEEIDIEILEPKNYHKDLSEENNPQTEDNDNLFVDVKKMRRKRASDPSKWKQNQCKIKRNSGEEYISKSGKIRKPRPVTACDKCRSKCKTKISSLEQNQLRKHYNNLPDYNAKKILLTNLVQEYKNKKNGKFTYIYFLPIQNDSIRVCRTFFCGTFGITSHLVSYVFQHNLDRQTMKYIGRKSGINEEKKVIRKNKEAHIIRHLNILQKRASKSTHGSVEIPFKSIGKCYFVFKNWMLEQGYQTEDIPSESLYRKIFNIEINLVSFQKTLWRPW